MGAGSKATAPALALGARGFAFSLVWLPGKTAPSGAEATGLARAITAAQGARVILVVRTAGASPPLSDSAQQQFCNYARNAVKSFPSVNDVVVGNEPNAPYFWRPQFNANGSSAAPAAYEALLARCYDVLHAFRPGINVAAPGTSPHGNDNPNAADNISHSPTRFIQGVAAAYRSSGRTQRIFDTVVHHPYGTVNGERPYEMHAGPSFIGEGDWNKLVGTYVAAFAGTPQAVPGRCLAPGPCVPLWYLESGFQTQARPGLSYHGFENVPTVPDISGGEAASPSPLATSTAPDQATQLRYALGLAYCQPYVEAIFNFLIRDDSNLLGYQSGVLWSDWRPKGSYGPLATVVAQLNARSLSCAAPTARPLRPGSCWTSRAGSVSAGALPRARSASRATACTGTVTCWDPRPGCPMSIPALPRTPDTATSYEATTRPVRPVKPRPQSPSRRRLSPRTLLPTGHVSSCAWGGARFASESCADSCPATSRDGRCARSSASTGRRSGGGAPGRTDRRAGRRPAPRAGASTRALSSAPSVPAEPAGSRD